MSALEEMAPGPLDDPPRCKVDGCMNEAPVRGRYAGRCKEHRGQVAAPSTNGAASQAEVLRAEAKQLSARADLCEQVAAGLERLAR